MAQTNVKKPATRKTAAKPRKSANKRPRNKKHLATPLEELLTRIERDLESATGFLETLGIKSFVEDLDTAADYVEGVRFDLECLKGAV